MHPKKALVRAAQLLKTVRQAGEFGVRTGDISFDWGAVQARKERFMAELRGHKGESPASAGSIS